MKKLIILAGISSLLFQSCSKGKAETTVLIRVNNQTARQLTDVKVFSSSPDGFTGGERSYGNVMAGASSLYQVHHKVFSIPLFEFNMEGVGKFEIHDLRCPVGINYLEPGKYSLLISEENNYPYVRFIRD
ncbi:MAG: hypothetical protein JNN00_02890 [Chitinophagaceae bacterium]|nr:hypothetical protein [Chitinophagaceae bacterium]